MKAIHPLKVVALLILSWSHTFSQGYMATYQCTGSGYLGEYPATISVTCDCQHTGYSDGSGDYQRCTGTIEAGNTQCQIYYEEYVNLAPYKGVLRTPSGDVYISVLDNSGGRFIIYSGRETLGPRDQYAEFSIRWTRVK